MSGIKLPIEKGQKFLSGATVVEIVCVSFRNSNLGAELSAMAVGYICGVIITLFGVSTWWRHETIKRGHAEYSQTTGQWQWKEAAK